MEADFEPTLREMEQRMKQRLEIMELPSLHPPYLPKTLSKFRSDLYAQAKKKLALGHDYIQLPTSDGRTSHTNRFLQQFSQRFDGDLVELMLNRLREPYTKKMLEENYQFDKLDLKQANSEFMLRTEIEELIGFACEWLLQVELCYDLLDRSRLYFDFKDLEEDYETVKDRLTAKNKFTLSGFSAGIIRKTLVFLLKRASQLLDIYGKSQIQSLFPSMLLLVYSMVGSTAIPWALKLPRMNIAVIVGALLGPMMLNNAAQSITKAETSDLMKKLAKAMSETAQNLEQYNELLANAIKDCLTCREFAEFNHKRALLYRYIRELEVQQESVMDFDEKKFAQIRQQVDQQFARYYQLIYREGWSLLFSEEDYELYKGAVAQLEQSIANEL